MPAYWRIVQRRWRYIVGIHAARERVLARLAEVARRDRSPALPDRLRCRRSCSSMPDRYGARRVEPSSSSHATLRFSRCPHGSPSAASSISRLRRNLDGIDAVRPCDALQLHRPRLSRTGTRRSCPTRSWTSEETTISPPLADEAMRAAYATACPKKSSASRSASPTCSPIRTRTGEPGSLEALGDASLDRDRTSDGRARRREGEHEAVALVLHDRAPEFGRRVLQHAVVGAQHVEPPLVARGGRSAVSSPRCR